MDSNNIAIRKTRVKYNKTRVYHKLNGYKHGPYTEYYPDGTIFKQAHYVFGELDGEYIEYHPNRVRKVVATYNNGKLTGVYIDAYDNGNIRIKKHCIDDKATGIYYEYRRDGSIKYIAQYKDNKLWGPLVRYYRYGRIKSRYFAINGISDGYSIKYYDNRNENKLSVYFPDAIESSVRFVNGKPIGWFKVYNKYGRLMQNDYLTMPLQRICHYHKNGRVLIRYTMSMTGYQGEYVKYHKNGIPHIKCFYKDGDRIGEYKAFYKTGQPKITCEYDKGRLIRDYIKYDKNGVIIRHYKP